MNIRMENIGLTLLFYPYSPTKVHGLVSTFIMRSPQKSYLLRCVHVSPYWSPMIEQLVALIQTV